MQSAVEEIMEQFPFEQVHAYMVLTGWRWLSGKGLFGVPTLEQVRDTARDLLTRAEASERTRYEIMTGGFRATATRSRVEPDELHLSFEPWGTTAYLMDAARRIEEGKNG